MLPYSKSKCLSPSPNFVYDEACLDVENFSNDAVVVYQQYMECDKCNFENLTILNPDSKTSVLINSKYYVQMYYTANNDSHLCQWSNILLEHYRYGWTISDKCSSLYIKKSAESAYLPIITAFVTLFIFGTLWYMVKCFYKCTRNRDHWRRYVFWVSSEIQMDTIDRYDSVPVVNMRHPHRIKSIDVFRGFCIMIMIFTNSGGGQYWFFKHSVWNGLTFADVVFPWFLWIMGFSFFVSLSTKLRRAVPRRYIIIQILRRSSLLILLGFVINSHSGSSDLTTMRFPGVLQRIGVTYLIVGLTETAFAKRTEDVREFGRLVILKDIFVCWPQWLVMILLFVVHTFITYGVSIPGCGRGYVGPGGLHDYGKFYNCTGGAAGYIDRIVFGKHIYKHPTCETVYKTVVPYDPEGLLGILTCIVLVYFGVQTGRIFKSYGDVRNKAVRWIIWGIVTGLLGGILCKFSKNDGFIPVNKNLWSLSFILVLAGLAFLIFAFLFILVDVKKKWGGRPLFYPGMNPLILYIGSEILKTTFPFYWKIEEKSHGTFLAMNLWSTALWVAISIFLYKKNIFISI